MSNCNSSVEPLSGDTKISLKEYINLLKKKLGKTIIIQYVQIRNAGELHCIYNMLKKCIYNHIKVIP